MSSAASRRNALMQHRAGGLSEGAPNRSRIVNQVMEDVLEEADSAAGPGRVLPDGPKIDSSLLVDKLRARMDASQGD